MKKNQILVLFFLLSILLNGCGDELGKDGNHEEQNVVGQNIDNYFTALLELEKFNGVVLAYQNDSLVLAKEYNLTEVRDSSTFVNLDYQFDIHSISKLMTKYLIYSLESKGALSRNQMINTFYPDFPKGEFISINLLLEHSSGLPRELGDFQGQESDLTSSEIVEYAKKQALLFEPGSDIQYSNVGYEILYDIVSKSYKKPFAQCVVDEIFVPLGMKDSGAHFFTKRKNIKSLAKNHTLVDSVIRQVPNILEDEFITARFFSTASDLNIFLKHVTESSFYQDIMTEEGIIAKDGGSKGIRAQVYSDVKNKFRFVLLANFDEMPFFKTVDALVKILKNEPFDIPKELNRVSMELKKEVLSQYVGSYCFADFDGLALEVEIQGSNLVVYQDKEKIATLRAESSTLFFENPKSPDSFEFIENELGSFDVLMGWKGIEVEGKRL